MKRILKQKKCKACQEPYTPYSSLSQTCSIECAISHTEAKAEKKLKQDIKFAEKVARFDMRVRKEKLKKRSAWIKDYQQIFNKFIRLRDIHEFISMDEEITCISCGKSEAELKINHHISMVCGHFLSVGGFPELRFTENNAHLQCTRCNGGAGKYGQFNGKGLTVTKDYRINLIKKIGQKNVDVLEGPHEPLKLSIDEIKAKIIEYKSKIKGLEQCS